MATDVLVKGSPFGTGGYQEGVLKHFGPASYTQVTPGTTPSGGDTVYASQFGLKVIHCLEVAGDNTGTYVVVPIPDANTVTGQIVGSAYALRWFTAASMAEVAGAVNLSASFVKLRAIGY
jgi:hypothetical protein